MQLTFLRAMGADLRSALLQQLTRARCNEIKSLFYLLLLQRYTGEYQLILQNSMGS